MDKIPKYIFNLMAMRPLKYARRIYSFLSNLQFYHMKKSKIFLTVAALFVSASVSFSEIKMPRIFGDHMMVQREEPVNVWGMADAGAKVEVDFAGQKVSTKAGADGRWYARLKPMKASAQPRTMKIFENGKESKTIEDVLVGEVWIAGGQSNMAFGLNGMEDAKSVVEKADLVKVRYFNQPKNNPQPVPQFDTADDSKWHVCSAQNAGGMSAVAYTFAQRLALALDVPVGIVQTAVSGTPMRSWIPIEEFENNPLFGDSYKNYQARLKKWDYEAELKKWNEFVRTYPERVEKAKAEGKEPPPQWTISDTLKPWKDSPDGFRKPSNLYNGRIAPLVNFTARGIIWYQGENDNLRTGFKDQFKGLIEIWRKLWRKPDMPFLFVQLPSWTCVNWEYMRWDQFRTCKELKNVGMAVAIDTGLEDDVHPFDKLPFIERLSKIALRDVYGKKDALGYGPLFKSAKISGDRAKVDFYMFGKKLVVKGEPRGFEVLLADGKWVPAVAKQSGNSILVKSANPDDKKIAGVRYLWKDWARPNVCIYNDADIPAPGFTTEDLK